MPNSVDRAASSRPTTPADLLEFFYPVHYQMGTALEEVLSGGVLSRKQVAILWLIRSEGRAGQMMRRKEIERALQTWFEISPSAVSKALREMHRPPLEYVAIEEDPDSGREKRVSLTARGRRFLHDTTARAVVYVEKLAEDMTPETLDGGAAYLRGLTLGYQRLSRSGELRVVRGNREQSAGRTKGH